MKKSLLLSITAVTLSLAFSLPSVAVETDAGLIDLSQFTPSGTGQFVEVNLSQGMLKFASKIAARQEPEAAALINNLKRIRVNVIGMDDSNRDDTIKKIKLIRHKLGVEGWAQIVSVRDESAGDNVDVHIKQRGDDEIEGLAVTVLNTKGEAVVVNIVGNITADQLGLIADKFDFDHLKDLHLPRDHRAKVTVRD